MGGTVLLLVRVSRKRGELVFSTWTDPVTPTYINSGLQHGRVTGPLEGTLLAKRLRPAGRYILIYLD